MKRSLLWAFALLPAASAPADVVIDANLEILAAIRTLAVPPPVASRNMAILHTAVFDAVNGIAPRYESYRVAPAAPAGSSMQAAAAGAAYRVLDALYGSNATLQTSFSAYYQAALSPLPNNQAKADGLVWGQMVADNILAWRATDNSTLLVPYTPGTSPGDWQPTPPGFAPALLPQWPQVTPWTMNNGAQFRPSGPPALTSVTYAADYNETLSLGRYIDPALRTAEQQANAATALFWADGAGTETPPGHWNAIAQGVAATSLTDTLDRARLFAALNTTLADAAITCWDTKYAYDFWRPVTAIRQGDTDGNDATAADVLWSPVLVTPPFPEYTSGHSTFSGAASSVLASLLGTDKIEFTTDSDAAPGDVRTYDSFTAAAGEAGRSRIYGGIHFQFSNRDGLEAGRDLGSYVAANFFQPLATIPEPGSLSLLFGTLWLTLLRRRHGPR
jgi:hypothetical protein